MRDEATRPPAGAMTWAETEQLPPRAPAARPTPADESAAAGLADGVVGVGLGLPTLLWLVDQVGLLAGWPITRGHLVLAAGLTLALHLARQRSAWRRLATWLAPAVVALLAAGSMALAAATVDPSFDGNAYHLVSIIALRLGWNPWWQPHVMDWLPVARPDLAELARLVGDAGQWTDHYPKAAWLLGANASLALDSLDAGKWLGPYLLAVAVPAVWTGLRDAGLRGPLPLAAALALCASPVVLAQFGTHYVDGLVGSALAIQAGTGLSALLARRPGALWATFAAALLASGFKFNGAAYAVVLLAALGVAWFALPLRPRVSAGLRWPAGLAALAVGLLTLWSPYGHNLLVHGHPLHPIQAIPVVRGQASDDFLARNRVQKFLLASLQAPNDRIGDEPPALVLPRLEHYESAATEFDRRANGFGPHFLVSLGLALLTLPLLARRAARRPGARAAVAALLGLAAWAVGSSLINPELWWSRYVPQLWWLPPLAAALAALAGLRWLAWLHLAPALVSAALLGFFWGRHLVAERLPDKAEFVRLLRQGPLEVDDTVHNRLMMFALGAQAAQHGGTARLVPRCACDTRWLLFVGTCVPQAACPRRAVRP